jgi:mannose/fructose/N-acetylgalactosamine-specific phosphotransferase system component IIC
MSLDFMRPEIWDGLVIGVILVGVALAILRLMNDYSRYQRKQQRKNARKDQQPYDME